MPQDVCCLLWSSINISLPLFPFWNGVQMTNWFHWMWGHMYSRNKLFSACTQQTSMFLLSLVWGFKLAAVMKMFFENWLWKWILCVFPVTKAGGWSEEGPVVISFSLSSPSSGSVLLSLFPKNLYFSTLPQLRVCFCCPVLPGVSGGCCPCISCNMFVFLGGFVSHCSQPCLSHDVLTRADPYMLWWDFKVFRRRVFECRNRLVFREWGRWMVELSKSVCSYYFL